MEESYKQELKDIKNYLVLLNQRNVEIIKLLKEVVKNGNTK